MFSQAKEAAQIAKLALWARLAELKKKDDELAAAQDELRWQGERIEVLAKREANLQVTDFEPLKSLSHDVYTPPCRAMDV